MSSHWTIESAKQAIAAKRISARELAAEHYNRIGPRNPDINASPALRQDRASPQAEKMAALVAAGNPLPPLAGVPIAIKDTISTKGTPTTCGSKILERYVPPYDATTVTRLEAAG